MRAVAVDTTMFKNDVFKTRIRINKKRVYTCVALKLLQYLFNLFFFTFHGFRHHRRDFARKNTRRFTCYSIRTL